MKKHMKYVWIGLAVIAVLGFLYINICIVYSKGGESDLLGHMRPLLIIYWGRATYPDLPFLVTFNEYGYFRHCVDWRDKGYTSKLSCGNATMAQLERAKELYVWRGK